jgi:N-acetyl-anhydromuramoyl-L-alanine amidase
MSKALDNEITVKAVQARLNLLGANPALKVDGWAGGVTRAAILNALPLEAGWVKESGDIGFFESFEASPHFGGTLKPRGIVLHHSCGTWEGDRSWMRHAESKVSYHCLINTNGARVQFVSYKRVAWHAGVSVFKGRGNCNDFMLGLAFTGDTVSGERRPQKSLTPMELASAVEWIGQRMVEFGIERDWITTHAIISPRRKDDVSAAVYEQIMEAL